MTKQKIAIALFVVVAAYAAVFILVIRSGPPISEYIPLRGKPIVSDKTTIFIPARGIPRAARTAIYFLFAPAGAIDRMITGKSYGCAYEDSDV
jgi:hypothetical protein